MKIVHIIIGLDIGGAELMLKRLIEGLNGQKGMTHSVISLTDIGSIGKQLQNSGIEVTVLGLKNTLSWPIISFNLRRELKKQKPDIVQTWMYHADFIGGLAAKSIGVNKIIWNIRNTYLSKGSRLCALLSSIVPSEIIYVSHSAQISHLKSGYASDKGVVIGNGFDTDKYIFNSGNRDNYRAELNLQPDDMAVFSVGRCVPAKDHSTFIKAICEASKNNSKIKGVLIGRNIDLDNFSLSSIEKKYFIVLGERQDISMLLSAADVFCLHSITEGFPNVLGEAMSVGLPCITTKAGDAEMILSDKEYTVETGDFSSIAKLIIKLTEEDISYRSSIGRKNRDTVLKKFSLEVVRNEYISLYEE